MAPAQPFTEIEQDCRPYMTVKVELDTESRISLESPVGERLRCTNNCEDTAVMMGPSLLNREDKAAICVVDAELDIMECKNDHHSSLQAETEDPDATEYSSSFADTMSDAENFSGFSEGEVQSQIFADNGLTSAFDAFNSAFQMRKKKLTNHWRTYIRPVMWRCKWMELRIKEIESQSLKYSRELAVVYNQRKHSGLDQFALEEFGSKSLPFSSQCRRKKAMKRRKRKRVEETTDIASYISNHNVFSYLENKGSDPDSTSVADECSNAVISEHTADYNDKLITCDDVSFFEFQDGDKYLEQVLSKIETLDSRVHNLKNQINVVMSTNAARFSSSENLSFLVPCDAQTSSAHSPPLSAGNGQTVSAGAVYTSAQYMSEYNLEDLVMPESAVSSIGEAITVPDIIESTVGLLSGIDVTFHQPQFGDSSDDVLDNALIQNEAADGEKQAFQMISDQPKEKHEQAEKGIREEDSFPTPQLEPGDALAEADVPPQGQLTLESCLASDLNFPRNKRKRGERKAGSVVWSKKCSGEPDSQ